MLPSALFVAYLAYSVWNLKLSPEEKAEREAEAQSDLEMKKISMYGTDEDISQDDRREMNRQMFLNLPKTPNTPGFGGGLNPMTPRTTAFTQLNGGKAPAVNTRSVGPSSRLPFRDYDGTPDGR